MGYSDSKKKLSQYLVENGFIEIEQVKDNEESAHSGVHKGFTIFPLEPELANIMGGSSISVLTAQLNVSFITTTNEQHDQAYEDWIKVINYINSQTTIVTPPTFERMEEVNYRLGSVSFNIGSSKCE